eukprot:2312663-Amphidinium_carterae.1
MAIGVGQQTSFVSCTATSVQQGIHCQTGGYFDELILKGMLPFFDLRRIAKWSSCYGSSFGNRSDKLQRVELQKDQIGSCPNTTKQHNLTT